ncbi:SET domain-containing protein [Leucogyrophana mollusca]|uniref:SET domain-containing protein n=1 Tax=Leucogyrophana mollusca TaxID=85980 RepID=A0ACB8BRS1_9AGAM|nr:SET domain-containing protein [Leucogyrophana mollusca]
MSTPIVNSFLGNPLIDLRSTAYGGRSLFARCSISPNTLIHTSYAPYAHVVYNDFRKEICAQCFAYAFTSNLREWSTKWSKDGAATVFFCSEECRKAWKQDVVGEIIAEVNGALRKAARAVKKSKGKVLSPGVGAMAEAITQKDIDKAWAEADAFVCSKSTLATSHAAPFLEDMELEIARFVASAIVHRYVTDHPGASAITTDSGSRLDQASWMSFLQLQDNELPNVHSRPYILPIHLRIYKFLSFALPAHLRPYAPTTVRVVLARDSGNSFGIWEGEGGEEMFGWGMWASASYFNHNCAPNVRKTRQGRTLQFTTSRVVEEGEELCISYVDVDQPRNERVTALEERWFFTSCSIALSQWIQSGPRLLGSDGNRSRIRSHSLKAGR